MFKTFQTDCADTLKLKSLHWANSFSTACLFDSNQYADPYSAFDLMVGCEVKKEIFHSGKGSSKEIESFLKDNTSYVIGYFSYDLKNESEELFSNNPDHLNFPEFHFFSPKNLVFIKGNEVKIESKNPDEIWQAINNFEIPSLDQKLHKREIKGRFSRAEYIATVKEIQKHIQRGDIYEINFCQEFYIENTTINPVEIFINLNKLSPTPFASYFKLNGKYVLSASPERFLSRRDYKIISQPIKGTSPRKTDKFEDEQQKKSLLENEKERSENVMIVDLVRNDLTKSAKEGTVRVEELFGLYSFKQVHQMISTIVCEAKEGISNPEIILNTFPMGSMTGAPKISAMQLAEKYERSKRGVYSGALGYFSPNGDFDFNVVIRSILYNEQSKYVSFHVGSAITLDSNPEMEYEECLLKGKAITQVLSE